MLESMPDIENVILITIDCLRADHLEIYGYPRETSPNITRIAREGVFFRNVVANGPFTLASFPSIMTSSYPLQGDVYYSLNGRPPLLSELLKQEGFSTAAFNPNILLTVRCDYTKGFDHYEGYLPRISREFSAVTEVRSTHITKKLKDTAISLSKKYPAFELLLYLFSRAWRQFPTEVASKVTSDAIDWIKRNRGRPFFLWIHYMDAHEPYFLERLDMERYYSKWANIFHKMKARYLHSKIILREKGPSEKDTDFLRRYLIDTYDDRIRYIDQNIGRLIKTLESEGLSSRTAVIITSDHGQAFLEHENLYHKASFYEENLRVPLIMWGGEINESHINPATPASLMDIPPTVMSLLNLRPHRDFMGKDLTKNVDREFIIAEASYDEHGLPFYRVPESSKINFSFVVYLGNYKYIKHIPMKGHPSYELYDLRTDPEERNSINKNGDLIEKFDIILTNHMNEISLNIEREIIKFNVKLMKVRHKVK